jgi:histidyl-tRNA synthetase
MKKNPLTFSYPALISAYYGFFPLVRSEKPSPSKEQLESIKKSLKDKNLKLKDWWQVEEIASILFGYEGSYPQKEGEPRAMYYESSKRKNTEQINLHIIGSEKSIAEGTLFKTAQVILEEAGIKKFCWRINSIGGKDAQNQFNKQATNYFRTNIGKLNADGRQAFKKGIYYIYAENAEKNELVLEHAPAPLDYIEEESRAHFGQVIEFLETMEIPYEIDKTLLGDLNYSSHTIFEIVDLSTDKIIGRGSRYNLLSKKIGCKKEIPGIGIVLDVPTKNKKIKESEINAFKNPKFGFVQIGYDAKLHSLMILEELRKSKIPVFQTLNREKISTQLAFARKAKVEHLIIVGQKESIDKTALVRDIQGRSQKVVTVKELPVYLKSLK